MLSDTFKTDLEKGLVKISDHTGQCTRDVIATLKDRATQQPKPPENVTKENLSNEVREAVEWVKIIVANKLPLYFDLDTPKKYIETLIRAATQNMGGAKYGSGVDGKGIYIDPNATSCKSCDISAARTEHYKQENIALRSQIEIYKAANKDDLQ